MCRVDAEAAQFAVEVGAIHPHFARQFGDVAVAVAEVFEQVLALEDFARVPEGHVFRDDLRPEVVRVAVFVRDERRFGFVRADFGFVAVDEQALYEVFEFADVARVPVVLAQEVLGGEAEVAVGQLFVVGVLLAVVVEQFGDVFAVLFERGDADGGDGDVVVEAGGQAFFEDVQWQAGRGDDACFAGLRAVVVAGVVFVVFEQVLQGGLDVFAQVADFVEVEGAVVCLGDEAGAFVGA